MDFPKTPVTNALDMRLLIDVEPVKMFLEAHNGAIRTLVLKHYTLDLMATAVTEAVMAHYALLDLALVYKEQDSSHWATLRWKFNVAMEASTESHFNGLTPRTDLTFLHDFFTLLTDEYRLHELIRETLTSYTYEFRCMLLVRLPRITVEIPVKELDQDEMGVVGYLPDGMRFLDLVVDTEC
ncbi:hypothetical protein SPFM20_00281 [Salmonella phage SPFM20]|nr:hypothetical protein SPFM8_00280 [Salmonella phage SPFM8]VFR14959.1 hypothetical protein SPFM20_00281 [Salmonella phage SPFM20]